MYYFYVLQSLKDRDLYWGYTSDLRSRLKQHQAGDTKSTRHRRPLRLIYYEAYLAKADAQNRERQIKKRAQAFTGLKCRIPASIKIFLSVGARQLEPRSNARPR